MNNGGQSISVLEDGRSERVMCGLVENVSTRRISGYLEEGFLRIQHRIFEEIRHLLGNVTGIELKNRTLLDINVQRVPFPPVSQRFD